MIADELRDRTRKFALDIVDLCLALPADDLGRLVRPQLLRAGTGVASNYRASQRSRSRKEFIGRIAVAIEEADESELWMDILQHRASEPAAKVAKLRTEATELRAIFAKSRSTAIANVKRWPA